MTAKPGQIGPAAGAEPTYTWTTLAAAAGVSPRSVRYYTERGVLPAPKFRGPATTYGRDHLVRLRAAVRLRRDERLPLDAIRVRLAGLSQEALEALAGLAPVAPPTVATHVATPAAPPLTEGYRPEVARPREHWTRITLFPGVELHVRADADTEADRLTREIVARYAVAPG